ncbi:MAG: rhomboid family intramembrane serine protease [Candidatus Micrarchaeota archaeon]
MPRLKFPLGTALLAVLMLAFHLHLSRGLLYASEAALLPFVLHYTSLPTSFFTYPFVHAGVLHLAGNLVPFLLFGALLESIAGTAVFLLVFAISALAAGAVFLLASPSVALAGASAGITGVIGAAIVSRPKLTFLLVLVSLVLAHFTILPLVDNAFNQQVDGFSEARDDLSNLAGVLAERNESEAAVAVAAQAAEAGGNVARLEAGRSLEASAPSDFLAHSVGALVGVAFILFFRKDLAAAGSREFWQAVSKVRGFRRSAFRLGR